MEKIAKKQSGQQKFLRDLGKVGVTITACGLIFAGAAMAYFTANGTAENVFTIYGGNNGETLDIRIDEPDWDPDADHTVLPGTELKNNPMITNTEGVDAYALMKVTIPQGTVGGTANSPLFALNQLNTGTDKQEWTSQGSWTEDGKKIEVYSYNSTIAKDESTAPLFASVSFSPLLTNAEVNALDSSLSIDIEAFSVQKDNIADAAAALALSGWVKNV